MITSTPAPFQRACIEALHTDPELFLIQYRKRRTPKKAMRDHFIIGVLCLSLVVVAGYFISINNPQLPIKTTAVKSPYSKMAYSFNKALYLL